MLTLGTNCTENNQTPQRLMRAKSWPSSEAIAHIESSIAHNFVEHRLVAVTYGSHSEVALFIC